MLVEFKLVVKGNYFLSRRNDDWRRVNLIRNKQFPTIQQMILNNRKALSKQNYRKNNGFINT